MSILRGIIGALGLVVLASACGDSPDALGGGRDDSAPLGTATQQLTTVTLKWTTASPSGASSPFIGLAQRSDGSALATTKDSVVAISPTGVKTTLFGGASGAGKPIVQRGSEGFVVPIGNAVSVYDLTGTRKTSINIAINEYARLIPGSLSTFIPRAKSGDPEGSAIDQARIYAETGALSASFTANNLVQSRATKTHLFWATRPGGLRKTTLAGGPVWSNASITAHQFETDDAGRFLIVNRAGDTRVVELYDQTARIGASTFEAPIWNLAIAPAGQFAAANSKTIARLFNGGKPQASVQLDRVMPVSLDVSDLGYLLIGTQDRVKKITAVSLYGSNGGLVWSKTFGEDDNGYRPDVRFAPDGRGFFVRDKNGLSFYTLVGV